MRYAINTPWTWPQPGKGPHAPQRILPSQIVRQRINRISSDGVPGEADIATLVIRLGVERPVQEMLAQEVTDYLGRGHYRRRRSDQEHRGYRNGSEPGYLYTAEGQISVQVPQVRGGPAPYRSQVMTALRGHSDVLERLAVAMDTRGLSTRDIEAAFEETTGPGARLLGRSAVSELTETLWQDFEAFSQ